MVTRFSEGGVGFEQGADRLFPSFRSCSWLSLLFVVEKKFDFIHSWFAWALVIMSFIIGGGTCVSPRCQGVSGHKSLVFSQIWRISLPRMCVVSWDMLEEKVSRLRFRYVREIEQLGGSRIWPRSGCSLNLYRCRSFLPNHLLVSPVWRRRSSICGGLWFVWLSFSRGTSERFDKSWILLHGSRQMVCGLVFTLNRVVSSFGPLMHPSTIGFHLIALVVWWLFCAGFEDLSSRSSATISSPSLVSPRN